jgi:CheY-like chemotaxis protein
MIDWREKPRVLIVDDDDEFIADLKVLLSSEFEVSGVTGTRQAKELLAAYRPDCLLLDLNMPIHFGTDPDKEGLSFLEHIRGLAAFGPSGDIPVIVLTARQKVDFLAVANEYGITTLYSKPPDIKRLKTSIWDLVTDVNEGVS